MKSLLRLDGKKAAESKIKKIILFEKRKESDK